MTPPSVGRVRRAIVAGWLLPLAPFLLAGVWTPAARALGLFAEVPVAAVVAAGVGTSALALLLCARIQPPPGGRVGLAASLGLTASVVVAGIGPALALLAPLVILLAVAVCEVGHRAGELLPPSLDERPLRARLGRAVAWTLVVALGTFQAARVGAFLGDPAFVEGSILPVEFLQRHSCLTAYVHAVRLAEAEANVYDLAFVSPSGPDFEGALPPSAAGMEPFTLDPYGYPPPFLLLPRAMMLVTTDFVSLRAAFGALCAASLWAAAWALSQRVGGLAGERMAWLGPIVLTSFPVLLTVQMGNFHVVGVPLVVGAWIAFSRERAGSGGAFLAAAALAKIAPALLGVVLLAQRRWRAAGATVAAAVVLCAVALPVTGSATWVDFFRYHLPAVQSGRALAFLAADGPSISVNFGPFGLPFKLAALGVPLPADPWALGPRVNDVYTLVVLGLAVLAGVRRMPLDRSATTWMAVATLAALRSPFAPPHVLTGLVFVLFVMVGEVRGRVQTAAYVGAWLLFLMHVPIEDPVAMMTVSLVKQVLLLLFLGWLVARPLPRA